MTKAMTTSTLIYELALLEIAHSFPNITAVSHTGIPVENSPYTSPTKKWI
jgi:hypothetical protein